MALYLHLVNCWKCAIGFFLIFAGSLIVFLDLALAVDRAICWQNNWGKDPTKNDKPDGNYIMRRIGPGMAGWTIYTIAAPEGTCYTVTLPDDHTRHCFAIVAFNIKGEAPPSNNLCLRGN